MFRVKNKDTKTTSLASFDKIYGIHGKKYG